MAGSGVVSYGLERPSGRNMVWYGKVSSGMVGLGLVRRGLVWCGMVG